MKFGIGDTLKFVLLAFASCRVNVALINLHRARVEAAYCEKELVHSVGLEFCWDLQRLFEECFDVVNITWSSKKKVCDTVESSSESI
jgi:hypothetical protein